MTNQQVDTPLISLTTETKFSVLRVINENLIFALKTELRREFTEMEQEQRVERLQISQRLYDLNPSGDRNESQKEVALFRSSYCRSLNKVSIIENEIHDEKYRGLGLGSYLIDRAIGWLESHYVDALVDPIRLSERVGGDITNRERRNRFYERLSVKFNWVDDRKTTGVSHPDMMFSNLTAATHSYRVEEVSCQDFMWKILCENHYLTIQKRDFQQAFDKVFEDRDKMAQREGKLLERVQSQLREQSERLGLISILLGAIGVFYMLITFVTINS